MASTIISNMKEQRLDNSAYQPVVKQIIPRSENDAPVASAHQALLTGAHSMRLHELLYGDETIAPEQHSSSEELTIADGSCRIEVMRHFGVKSGVFAWCGELSMQRFTAQVHGSESKVVQYRLPNMLVRHIVAAEEVRFDCSIMNAREQECGTIMMLSRSSDVTSLQYQITAAPESVSIELLQSAVEQLTMILDFADRIMIEIFHLHVLRQSLDDPRKSLEWSSRSRNFTIRYGFCSCSVLQKVQLTNVGVWDYAQLTTSHIWSGVTYASRSLTYRIYPLGFSPEEFRFSPPKSGLITGLEEQLSATGELIGELRKYTGSGGEQHASRHLYWSGFEMFRAVDGCIERVPEEFADHEMLDYPYEIPLSRLLGEDPVPRGLSGRHMDTIPFMALDRLENDTLRGASVVFEATRGVTNHRFVHVWRHLPDGGVEQLATVETRLRTKSNKPETRGIFRRTREPSEWRHVDMSMRIRLQDPVTGELRNAHLRLQKRGCGNRVERQSISFTVERKPWLLVAHDASARTVRLLTSNSGEPLIDAHFHYKRCGDRDTKQDRDSVPESHAYSSLSEQERRLRIARLARVYLRDSFQLLTLIPLGIAAVIALPGQNSSDPEEEPTLEMQLEYNSIGAIMEGIPNILQIFRDLGTLPLLQNLQVPGTRALLDTLLPRLKNMLNRLPQETRHVAGECGVVGGCPFCLVESPTVTTVGALNYMFSNTSRISSLAQTQSIMDLRPSVEARGFEINTRTILAPDGTSYFSVNQIIDGSVLKINYTLRNTPRVSEFGNGKSKSSKRRADANKEGGDETQPLISASSVHINIAGGRRELRADLDSENRLRVKLGDRAVNWIQNPSIYKAAFYTEGESEERKPCIVKLELLHDSQVATHDRNDKLRVSKARVAWIRPVTVDLKHGSMFYNDELQEICVLCNDNMRNARGVNAPGVADECRHTYCSVCIGRILESAQPCCPECRSSWVNSTSVEESPPAGEAGIQMAYSIYYRAGEFPYPLGATLLIDNFDENLDENCSNGMHGYLTANDSELLIYFGLLDSINVRADENWNRANLASRVQGSEHQPHED
jgi:hypothetical protein